MEACPKQGSSLLRVLCCAEGFEESVLLQTFMQPVGAMAPSLAPQQSQIAMAGVLRVRG